MKKAFHFKQFTVNQDRCAMKIGTDGVLLGAWTSLENNPTSILDIGAGTGVLALMLAQRSAAQIIDAIEIDAAAYEQCTENFENSTWNDRLFCYHASLQEFSDEIEDTYNLIVCNPPFYSENYKTENESRDLARFNDAMPFEHILKAVSKLLSSDGIFTIIIPIKEEASIIDLAKTFGLVHNKVVHVKGRPESKIIRSLLEFSFRDKDLKKSELIIETERHNYTTDYINLTEDFYLKM